MQAVPYIPKQHKDIPDYYGIKVIYHDGTNEIFEGVHKFINNATMLDIVTKDDVWINIPTTSYRRLEFDNRFSKCISILEQQRLAANNK